MFLYEPSYTAPWCSYLVRSIDEVDGYSVGQRVVVRVLQQDGKDLHSGRFGLTTPMLKSSFKGALAICSILAHLSPVREDRE